MTEILSFRFRGKDIKYYDYGVYLPGFPTVEFHMNSELNFIEKNLNLKQGDTFIDIGSTYGSWTLPALSLGANVVAFDPSPIFGACLMENIRINKFNDYKRCVFFQKAVASVNGFVSYHMLYMSSLMRSFMEDTIIVKSMKLDSLDVERVDLIKIDVEGVEGDILMGAKSFLSKHKPHIILEHHPDLGEPLENIIPDNYEVIPLEDRYLLSPKYTTLPGN